MNPQLPYESSQVHRICDKFILFTMSKLEKVASASLTTLKARPLSALFSADSWPKEDATASATDTSLKPRMPLWACFSEDLWPKDDATTGASPPLSETEDITQQIAKLVRKLGVQSLKDCSKGLDTPLTLTAQ